MDFGIYPPEVNSGRMYAGPGSGPMLAAATAWDDLAAELYTTASSYQSVISTLTAGPWQGPSSAAMAAAAAPYAAWLSATAAQAQQTATQAKAAAAAYQEAFISTVPPPVVAANRSLLMTLVATNFFGQNTPAIGATEAQYVQMWAQDAAAMYGYAASSASATALTPFAAPDLRPAAAVPVAAAAIPEPLTTLSSLITVFFTGPVDLLGLVWVTPAAAMAPVTLVNCVISTETGLHTDALVSGWAGVTPWPGHGAAPPTQFSAVIPSPAAARVGEANTVGALSVPPTWTDAAPQVRPLTVALPAGEASATAAQALATGPGRTFGQMMLAGMTGCGMTGTVGAGCAQGGDKALTSSRATAHPAGGATVDDGQATHSKPRTVVTGIAARIRELAALRDEGELTNEEFNEEKNRLLGR